MEFLRKGGVTGDQYLAYLIKEVSVCSLSQQAAVLAASWTLMALQADGQGGDSLMACKTYCVNRQDATFLSWQRARLRGTSMERAPQDLTSVQQPQRGAAPQVAPGHSGSATQRGVQGTTGLPAHDQQVSAALVTIADSNMIMAEANNRMATAAMAAQGNASLAQQQQQQSSTKTVLEKSLAKTDPELWGRIQGWTNVTDFTKISSLSLIHQSEACRTACIVVWNFDQ